MGRNPVADQLDAAARRLTDHPAWRRKLRRLAHSYCRGEAADRAALELQKRLLPARVPRIRGLRIATRFISSCQGPSDIYDVFETGQGGVGFFMAAASGSGLASALLLTLAKVAIDDARARLVSPAAILERVNREILSRKTADLHLSAFLGLLDTSTLTMRYVNASHPCPILYGRRVVKPLCTGGQYLGRTKGLRYVERRVQIEPEDHIFFYSRGLVRACKAGRLPWSPTKIRRLLSDEREIGPDELLVRITRELGKRYADGAASCDVTLIAAELTGELAKETRIVVATDPGQMSGVVAAVLAKMGKLGYGERALFAVRLCLEEAIINAMKHGNRMDRTKKVTVSCRGDEREMRISVEDEGAGFHPEAVPDPRLPENVQLTHGRGLLLMRAYMDKVEHNTGGNRVTLVKKAPWR